MSQDINDSFPNDERNNDVKNELNKLSLRDLFFKYIRYLPFFVLSVAITLLAAFFYLRYSTRVYSSTGSLQIAIQSGKSGGNDKVEDLLLGNNKASNIQSEVEVLKSKPLMSRVVNRLNLQFSYTALGRIKDENAYRKAPFYIQAHTINDSLKSFSLKVSFIGGDKFKIDNSEESFSFGQVFENGFGQFELLKRGSPSAETNYRIDWLPVRSLVSRYTGGLQVTPRSSGSSLAIQMEANNPYLAADIVNAVMFQYDSMTIEQNNFSSDQMIGFIDIRLDTLQREIDRLQAEVLDFRQRENIVNEVAQSENYFQNFTAAETAILNEQSRLTSAEMIESYLKDKKNQFSSVVVPTSLGLDDPTLNNLVANFNSTQLSRQTLLESNILPDHPSVKTVEALVEQQRLMILENIQNLKRALLQAITTLQKRSLLDQRLWKEIPYKTKDLIALERQVTTKMALYALLESKREEAAISRASTTSTSKILDEAQPSLNPVRPNPGLIRIIALVVGLLVPALIIFLKEILNDKVTLRSDIEKITTTPILGEVGHSQSGNTLVVNKTSRTMVAEQFRTIRSNLQYVIKNNNKPVMMVTSSFSGEGKSFISTNMGAVMAIAGKKTIILEFDIRKPKVVSSLNLGRHSGISNYLVGKADLEDLIIPVPDQENLYILPCGPIPPNPSELLLDEKIAALFQWLRSRFDSIIIDTAPVGMVSDAITLGKFADSTLYIVRQGYTFKRQIGLVDELYMQKKLPAMGIVVNDVKLQGSGYGYYGYGRYGYGYGYGEKSGYYYEEQKPKGFWDKLFATVNPLNWFKKRK